MQNRITPIALALSLLGGAQAAQAVADVDLAWRGNTALTGVRLNAFDGNSKVFGGLAHELSYAQLAADGSLLGSLTAFSLEPQQSNSKLVSTYQQALFDGAQGSLLSALYTTSYRTGPAWDEVSQAAFQVAVWELTHEKSGAAYDVSAGSFRVAGAGKVTELAGSFVSQALAFTGTSRYTVYKLSSDRYQDMVTAQAVTAVPEPETYAMFLAGLAAIGLIARRRLPR